MPLNSHAYVIDISQQGKTTILISHRPRVILRADWVVFLEKGELKLQGYSQELSQVPGEHLDFIIPQLPKSHELAEMA